MLGAINCLKLILFNNSLVSISLAQRRKGRQGTNGTLNGESAGLISQLWIIFTALQGFILAVNFYLAARTAQELEDRVEEEFTSIPCCCCRRLQE